MKDIRANLKRLMLVTVADEQRRHCWDYHAVRPMVVPYSWHEGQHVKGDCSKGVQYLCKWAGAPDPFRENFDVWGNSQTLWLKCQHITLRELEVGDFVTMGHNGEEHATMVYEAPGAENNFDPLLWSFGHQGAPNFYRASADRREKQYLRNPVPRYVPTPEDKLRARTGWFAWVAWKLGEGDWRSHKPSDPKVRPHVPKRIPASWWVRYARFLKNRKTPNKPTTPKA